MPRRPAAPAPANLVSTAAVRARFDAFRRGRTTDRCFTHPAGAPYHATGFCYCDAPLWRAMGFYLKAALTRLLLVLPFNAPKIWILRRQGASIGRNVYISADTWIDPLFPELLTIEDGVLLGVGTRIFLHEFTADEFRAGKVIIRKGAVIGGFSLIGCGVEIGEAATVAGGAVVGQDIPAGATAIGNPARIIRRNPEATHG